MAGITLYLLVNIKNIFKDFMQGRKVSDEVVGCYEIMICKKYDDRVINILNFIFIEKFINIFNTQKYNT